MIFKCEICDSWKNGEGSEVCLKCTKYRYVGRENFKLDISYYKDYEQFPAPASFESLYPVSRERSIWDLINQLNWTEATMLTQYYFLEMTQADIAEYHNENQTKVNRIIAKSIEKIKNL